MTKYLDYGIELDPSCATDFRLVSRYIPFEAVSMTSVSPSSVNKSLKGKWASLACHETGSLVVQVTFTLTRLRSRCSVISIARV